MKLSRSTGSPFKTHGGSLAFSSTQPMLELDKTKSPQRRTVTAGGAGGIRFEGTPKRKTEWSGREIGVTPKRKTGTWSATSTNTWKQSAAGRTAKLLTPKRRQLPVGSQSVRLLQTRNETVSLQEKAAETMGPMLGRDPDHEREHRRAVQKAYGAWAESKREQRAWELAAADREMAEEERLLEAFGSAEERNEKAFRRWVATKQQQQREAKYAGAGMKQGPITIPDFLCAWRRCDLGGIDLLVDIQSLLMMLDATGKINYGKFENMMTQVDIQLKVNAWTKQLDAEAERQANRPAEERNQKRTKAEIEAARAEQVQQRIGLQILKQVAPNRQVFGTKLMAIRDLFNSMDTDGNGTLDKVEFKEGIKRMDLGINAGQQIELLKAFDADNSGEIDYTEFEEFLIRCKAKEEYGKEKMPSPKFDTAWEICKALKFDVRKVRTYFDMAMNNATDARKHRAETGTGMLRAAELKARLSANDAGECAYAQLSLTARKDLLKVFDEVWKITARDLRQRQGLVPIDEIDLFMMMIEQRHNEKEKDKAMSADEKRLNDVRYRSARQILRNAETSLVKYDKLLKGLQKCFSVASKAESDINRANRVLTIDRFKKSLMKAELGLSLVQVEDLARVFDLSGSGEVHTTDFVRYMHYANDRYSRDQEWKRDPRGKLCDDFLRNTPSHLVMPVLRQCYMQLQFDQPTKFKGIAKATMRRLSLASASGGGKVGSSAHLQQKKREPVPYDAEFDVSWGTELDMPPGSMSNTKHLKAQTPAPTPVAMDRRRGSIS